jgi:ubiquinone biosynthesis protein COQ9
MREPRKPAARKKTAKAAPDDAAKSDEAAKIAILAAALKDAAFDGFTDRVLEKAALDAGLTKKDAARLFPDGPIGLIAFYSAEVDRQMEETLAALALPSRMIRDRIKLAVLTRLSILKPNKEAARRAAALLSLPMHAGLGAKLMYATVDSMWRAAGDTATDFNFYTKRGILAGVYGSTLVKWFNDTGEDEAATDAFLSARIENVMQFEKFKAKAKTLFAGFANRSKSAS